MATNKRGRAPDAQVKWTHEKKSSWVKILKKKKIIKFLTPGGPPVGGWSENFQND